MKSVTSGKLKIEQSQHQRKQLSSIFGLRLILLRTERIKYNFPSFQPKQCDKATKTELVTEVERNWEYVIEDEVQQEAGFKTEERLTLHLNFWSCQQSYIEDRREKRNT